MGLLDREWRLSLEEAYSLCSIDGVKDIKRDLKRS
jgi:hypothetical protein